MVVFTNVSGRFAFDAAFSFNIVGSTNSMDLTDVSGNILHSTENNSRIKITLRQRSALRYEEELQVWSHVWYILWEKLCISSVMYMDTYHQPYWLGETKAMAGQIS